MATIKIPSFKLNNGLDIPALGYGTWLGLDQNKEFPAKDVPKLVEAMSYAIDVGYRQLDTAHFYRVEAEVGQVVKKKIEEGVIKREDVFITTKLWNHNHRPADVVKAAKEALERLGLDYIDLFLMHFPMSISVDGVDEKIDYLDTWGGFETILSQGLVKSIGVSNFNVEQLTRLLSNAKVKPVVNQVEINLHLGQEDLVDFCQKNDVLVVAYTAFGSQTPTRKTADSPAPTFQDPILKDIAKKYGKTVAQVTLRYLYQRGIANIPKTLTKSRVLENVSIFDFEIDQTDVETLKTYDINYRTVKSTFWQFADNYPFEKHDVEISEIPQSVLKF